MLDIIIYINNKQVYWSAKKKKECSVMDKRKSKMQIVYDFFKNEIESGAYLPGELFPSEAHIASQFNVSRPTIAKAKNLLREQGFIAKKKGYGTIVASNKQLNKQQELKFGVLIPSIGATGIFEPIWGMIADRSSVKGFKLVVNEENLSLMWGRGSITSEHNGRNAELLARKYAEEGVDGIFFAPLELFAQANEINHNVVEICQEAEIPVVLLDNDLVDYPQTGNFDLVCMDHVEAGYTVAKHLIDNGSRKIVFLTAEYVAKTIYKRIIGAKMALLDAGLSPESLEVIVTKWARNDDCLEKIKLIEKPDSLICFNDTPAAALIPELIENGYDIPRNFKVIGFDDSNYASLLKIPLSSYKQPCEAIAENAVNMLLSRIENPDMPARTVSIKGSLVVRDSTVLSR